MVLADLYFDLLAPETESTARTAIRLEDVGPRSDPEDLRGVADLLAARNIPFQVATYLVDIRHTDSNRHEHSALSRVDTPEVVEAPKYMQDRDTIIHHGTTHQYSGDHNPYSGESGADYEFIQTRCFATEQLPYQFEECQTDSWVRLIGPVVEDHANASSAAARSSPRRGSRHRRSSRPPPFGATLNVYEAISQLYDYRYQQVMYYPGLVSDGDTQTDGFVSQILPHPITAGFGITVFPENLGIVSGEPLHTPSHGQPS